MLNTKHAQKMASGEAEYQGKLLESQDNSDWKDEFVLIVLTLPILVLQFWHILVWSSDSVMSMDKVEMFFDKFSTLPTWFTNLWILVVSNQVYNMV